MSDSLDSTIETPQVDSLSLDTPVATIITVTLVSHTGTRFTIPRKCVALSAPLSLREDFDRNTTDFDLPEKRSDGTIDPTHVLSGITDAHLKIVVDTLNLHGSLPGDEILHMVKIQDKITMFNPIYVLKDNPFYQIVKDLTWDDVFKMDLYAQWFGLNDLMKANECRIAFLIKETSKDDLVKYKKGLTLIIDRDVKIETAKREREEKEAAEAKKAGVEA